MNQEAYLKAFGENCLRSIQITTAKNADYADPEDAFQNFENAAAISGVSVERSIVVRMADKMQRLSNLLQENRAAQVKDESIDDTLVDLMTYANIMLIYRKNVRQGDELENEIQEEINKAAAYRTGDIIHSYPASMAAQVEGSDQKQSWLSKLGWDK